MSDETAGQTNASQLFAQLHTVIGIIHFSAYLYHPTLTFDIQALTNSHSESYQCHQETIMRTKRTINTVLAFQPTATELYCAKETASKRDQVCGDPQWRMNIKIWREEEADSQSQENTQTTLRITIIAASS